MISIFNKNYTNSNVQFASGCRSIETARMACRKISLFSTTKKQPLITKLKTTNMEAMEFFEDLRNNYSHFDRRGGKISNTLTAYMDCSEKLGANRSNVPQKLDFETSEKLLDYISSKHCGNCGEAAESVAVILKMNGVKDVYVATVKCGDTAVNHEVCIFNRDGSPFDGKVKNNQTIIADAWSGIVDFANTALKNLKSLYAKQFYLDEGKNLKIDTQHVAGFNLNDKELDKLREKFPKFVL